MSDAHICYLDIGPKSHFLLLFNVLITSLLKCCQIITHSNYSTLSVKFDQTSTCVVNLSRTLLGLVILRCHKLILWCDQLRNTNTYMRHQWSTQLPSSMMREHSVERLKSHALTSSQTMCPCLWLMTRYFVQDQTTNAPSRISAGILLNR